jgi:hypothetical protein
MVTDVAGLPSPPPGLLAEPLKTRRLPSDDLAAVHRRRILPTVVTQTPQRVLHRRLLAPVLRGGEAQPPGRDARGCSNAWLAKIARGRLGSGLTDVAAG